MIGDVLAEDFRGPGRGNVLVVLAEFRLGGRGEQRLFEAGGLQQALGQLVAADGTCGLVVLPARAGDVAAHDAFHRQGLGLLHEDRTAFQFFAVGGQRGGELVHVAFDEVVLDEVGELLHPEQGDLVEDDAFVRDRLVHDDVKGGHAVRGDDEQGGVVDIVNIADLTSVEQGECRSWS